MSLEVKRKHAIILRKAGHSYGFIMKALKLSSKGTLSYWLSDLKLDKDVTEKIKRDGKISIKAGFDKFNTRRKKIIQDENLEYITRGKSLIKVNDKKDLLLLGAALYWGEGTKYEGKYPSLIFTNSDPKMVVVYLNFIRYGLNIEESFIKGGIHLHPHIDEAVARRYWSKITNLSYESFYVVNVKNRASQGIRDPKKLPYGMVVIKVNKRKFFYLVKGMIESLYKPEEWLSG